MRAQYTADVPVKLDDGTVVPVGGTVELEEDVARLHAGLVQRVHPQAPAADGGAAHVTE